MAENSILSDKPDASANSFLETEEAIARKDGLALLDDLIHIFYDRVLANIDKNFKTGDLIRMIELRYKLSPSNAEQEKFWAMLSKIRRDVLYFQHADAKKTHSSEQSLPLESPSNPSLVGACRDLKRKEKRKSKMISIISCSGVRTDSMQTHTYTSAFSMQTQKLFRMFALILLMCLLSYGGSAQAASSAFAARCNNSEDSVGGTSYTKLDSANIILRSNELVNAHRYLIMYNAALGSTNASGEIAARVMYGTTEIAEANYESDGESDGTGAPSLRNGPKSAQGGSLTGFFVMTANGTDSMWMEKKISAGGGYISGRCLMSIDLNNLTNNTHYFDSCVNGSGVVMIDSSDATTDTTLLTDSYTTAAGDYLVLASAEIWDSSGTVSTSFSYQGYLMIDGTIQGPAAGGKFTQEDLSDFWNWSYAKVHTFTAASHTFAIKIGNVDTPPASHQVYGRRPRIILIAESTYTDSMWQKSHAGFNTITTDYNTWATDTSMTYSNNTGTTENVVLIANGHIATATANQHGVVRLYNNTDAIAYSDVGTVCAREAGDTAAVSSIGFISALTNGTGKQILYRRAADSAAVDPLIGFVNLIAWNLKENLGGGAAPTTKRRRKLLTSEVRPEDIKPTDIASLLGLDCHCEK